MKCLICQSSSWVGVCWNCNKKYLPACYRRSPTRGYRLNECEAVNDAILYVGDKKYVLERMPPYVQYTNQSQEEFITQVTLVEAKVAFEAAYRYKMIALEREKTYSQIAEMHDYVLGQEYTIAHNVLAYLRGRQKNSNGAPLANLSRPPSHWRFSYKTWRDCIVGTARGLETEMLMAKI